MIKELQILLEVEKSLKILNSINFNKSNELKKHIENIRELQLQSFVENETYNFVLTDALQKKEDSKSNNTNNTNNYKY
jgi:hypothetical protein